MKMNKQTAIRQSTGERIFQVINTLFMAFLMLITIYPLLYVLFASFSEPVQLKANYGLLWRPLGFTTVGYEAVMSTDSIWRGFRNTVFYVILGTSISMLLTMMGGYAMSRKTMLRSPLMIFFTIPMFFGGGMIPTYLLVKSLKITNTIWAMVIPGAMSVYNVIVLRTYISSSIPYDLYESATLDGCSDFRYLIQIVIPLSEPILAVLVLWYAVGHWNSYFNAMIYLRTYTKNPLQIILRNLLILDEFTKGDFSSNVIAFEKAKRMRDLYKYSLIIVSTVPVMLLYPIIQKHFVKGVMLGSIKG